MNRRLFFLISVLLLSAVTIAQTLTVKTSRGTKEFSASEITSSSPIGFNNGTGMTIGGYTYSFSDITSVLVSSTDNGKVRQTCSVCKGDTYCTTCHGSGRGCKTCNGTGWYCKNCNTTGNCLRCNGTGICDNCGGDGKADCEHCVGYYGYCNTCKGLGWQIRVEWPCPLCGGFKYCLWCEGNYKNAENCQYCKNGVCRYCEGNKGKCSTCKGDPKCKTCGGDGHCAACTNHDGKCTNCKGSGYTLVDLLLSETSLNLSYKGDTKSFYITINTPWTISCSESWLTLTQNESSGKTRVEVKADANPSEYSRTANIIINYGGKSSYVRVTQEGIPVIKLSTDKIDFAATPTGSQTITIACNREWQASSNVSWLTVSPTKGNGDGTLTLTAEKNPTMDKRNAQVTLRYGDQTATIDVTQADGEGYITASIVTSYSYASGYQMLVINASDRRKWTVKLPAGDSWIHLNTSTNSVRTYEGMGNMNLMIYVDRNYGNTARSTSLSVSSGSYNMNWNITQDAPPMSLYNMVQKPFGFVNVDLINDSYSKVYSTLNSMFNLTMYSNAYHVDDYLNSLLKGISYNGLPLSYFGGRINFSGNSEYEYKFEIAKTEMSSSTFNTCVRNILADFSAINVAMRYQEYYSTSTKTLYDAYYDNVTFSMNVHSDGTTYRVIIVMEWK